MTKTNNNWILDPELWPNGEVPDEICLYPDQVDEMKQRYKVLTARRLHEKELADKLRQQEYEEGQRQKAKVQYSEALVNEICERISAGELLIDICDDYHMPTVKTAYKWLKANSDFNALFNQAIQDRLMIFEEQVISIADDITRDFKEITIKNVKKRVVDPEVIARAKLRIEVRFRHLEAGKAKWNKTSTLITKAEDADDPASMSNEELERRIADIERKERILRNVK